MILFARPRFSIALLLALFVGLVSAACSNESSAPATVSADDTAMIAASGGTGDCPSAADVSATAGMEFRDFPAATQSYGDSLMCVYQAADNSGVFLSVAEMNAAEFAEETFSAMRETVALMLGQSAQLESIEVGDRGYAYGSSSKTEAAAVAGPRFYHVEFSYSGAGIDLTDKRAAAVALLEQQASR